MTQISETTTGLITAPATALTALALTDRDIAAGSLAGVAMHFGRTNSNGWQVAAGALDLSPGGWPPAMLLGHDPVEPVGKWTSVEVVGNALYVEGKLTLATQRAKDARALIKDGSLTGLSIGLRLPPADGIRRERDGTFTIVKGELAEVSLVPIPADIGARISTIASASTPAQFEAWLRAHGMSKAIAERVTLHGWKGLPGAKSSDNKLLLARLADMRAQFKRLRRSQWTRN